MSGLVVFSAAFGFFLGAMLLNRWDYLFPVAVTVACLACVVLAWGASR